MINHDRFNEILAQYKEDFFADNWENVKCKWEAVKHFQDNWDINANNFAEMLTHSLPDVRTILVPMNIFSKGMIIKSAKIVPEEVRPLFVALFDESRDYWERIEEFKKRINSIMEETGQQGHSFQTENAITTYLWLRYPDRYYIYKFGEVRRVAEELGSDLQIKQGRYEENVHNHLSLYNEINAELRKDARLRALLDTSLTPDCYPDPKMRTLTIDFGFYISRYLHDELEADDDWTPPEDDGQWFPPKDDYDPGLTVQDWEMLLADPQVFTDKSIQIVKRMQDYGGEASCTQLAYTYGETMNFYNSGSTALAKRIAEKTGCTKPPEKYKNCKWWPILYLLRDANEDERGALVWKLREELSEALNHHDLSHVPLYASAEIEEFKGNYWWLNANPKIWSFSNITVGETQDYTFYTENGTKRRVFQNFLDARVGDKVICYESSPVKQIVAIATITAKQHGKRLSFQKVEGLSTPIDDKTLRECPELEKMEYFTAPQGTLFTLTPDEYNFILDIVREENPLAKPSAIEAYDKKEFLKDVYMDGTRYDELCAILERKKNIILQGAPGVGKTFCARRLAWSMMGKKDESRIEFVQFHQSYSYEDFIMGYRPEGDSFELKNGIFYNFCQKATNQPDKKFFFIIDEINRGNMSKIFGELLLLIESDYRGAKVTLPYNGLPFSVPENLYIIGMMNTADRSLAMIDYALRRRFSFIDMEPGFDTKGFTAYRKELRSETVDRLVNKVKDLNNEIAHDTSLGKGFRIGHSYFCGHASSEDANEWARQVVDYDILPMLREYWFDDESKVADWDSALHGMFHS